MRKIPYCESSFYLSKFSTQHLCCFKIGHFLKQNSTHIILKLLGNIKQILQLCETSFCRYGCYWCCLHSSLVSVAELLAPSSQQNMEGQQDTEGRNPWSRMSGLSHSSDWVPGASRDCPDRASGSTEPLRLNKVVGPGLWMPHGPLGPPTSSGDSPYLKMHRPGLQNTLTT